MFIPFAIPTSVKTHKQWVIDAMEIKFFGGYLIILIAALPPLIFSWIFGEILFSSFSIPQDHWIFILFIFGIGLFFWDRWLKYSYETEIKIVYIPIEYFSYIATGLALIFIYV